MENSYSKKLEIIFFDKKNLRISYKKTQVKEDRQVNKKNLREQIRQLEKEKKTLKKIIAFSRQK
jgi:hypothetical protein